MSTRTAAAEQKNVSDTAGVNAAVQLLPFIDYTLPGLCHCTTGTYCWCCQVFLLSCFTVMLLLVRHTFYVIRGGRIRYFDHLRKVFLRKQRGQDSKVDPNRLELEE